MHEVLAFELFSDQLFKIWIGRDIHATKVQKGFVLVHAWVDARLLLICTMSASQLPLSSPAALQAGFGRAPSPATPNALLLAVLNDRQLLLAHANKDEQALLGVHEYVLPNPTTPFEGVAELLAAYNYHAGLPYAVLGIFIPDFLLIPDSDFDTRNFENLYALTFREAAKAKLIVQGLPALGAQLVFEKPIGLDALLKECLPQGVQLVHTLGARLNSTVLNLVENIISLHIHFSNRHFEMLLFQGKNLLVANCYGYAAAEDAVYYALNVLQSLDLTTDECTVYLSGQVLPGAMLHTFFQKYFVRVQFANPFEGISLSGLEGPGQEHRWQSLQAVFQCAL